MTHYDPGSAGPQRALVELQFDDDETCEGLLVEITPHSATIDFPLEKASSLLIGEAYWLTFTGGRAGSANSSIKVLANIQYRGEDEHRCRYRFEISIEDSIAITTLIEHREALRVAPPEGEVIQVQLQCEGARPVGSALDSISKTGISVVLMVQDSVGLAERVELSFRLPDQADELRMWAIQRNRIERNGELRMGLEFEASSAVAFMRQQRLIENYIMHRQVELLRDLRSGRLTDV